MKPYRECSSAGRYVREFRSPAGRCDTAASFLAPSESYRADAERARTLGWPTIERIGNHLDIVNDADSVAGTIIDLAT